VGLRERAFQYIELNPASKPAMDRVPGPAQTLSGEPAVVVSYAPQQEELDSLDVVIREILRAEESETLYDLLLITLISFFRFRKVALFLLENGLQYQCVAHREIASLAEITIGKESLCISIGILPDSEEPQKVSELPECKEKALLVSAGAENILPLAYQNTLPGFIVLGSNEVIQDSTRSSLNLWQHVAAYMLTRMIAKRNRSRQQMVTSCIKGLSYRGRSNHLFAEELFHCLDQNLGWSQIQLWRLDYDHSVYTPMIQKGIVFPQSSQLTFDIIQIFISFFHSAAQGKNFNIRDMSSHVEISQRLRTFAAKGNLAAPAFFFPFLDGQRQSPPFFLLAYGVDAETLYQEMPDFWLELYQSLQSMKPGSDSAMEHDDPFTHLERVLDESLQGGRKVSLMKVTLKNLKRYQNLYGLESSRRLWRSIQKILSSHHRSELTFVRTGFGQFVLLVYDQNHEFAEKVGSELYSQMKQIEIADSFPLLLTYEIYHANSDFHTGAECIALL